MQPISQCLSNSQTQVLWNLHIAIDRHPDDETARHVPRPHMMRIMLVIMMMVMMMRKVMIDDEDADDEGDDDVDEWR